MTYAIRGRAATREAAKEFVSAEFERIIGESPVHRRDSEPVRSTLLAFVDLLPEDSTMDVQISATAFAANTGDSLTAVSASINVQLMRREEEAAR